MCPLLVCECVPCLRPINIQSQKPNRQNRKDDFIFVRPRSHLITTVYLRRSEQDWQDWLDQMDIECNICEVFITELKSTIVSLYENKSGCFSLHTYTVSKKQLASFRF